MGTACCVRRYNVPMDIIDLHTHTCVRRRASPAELVRRAAAVGIGTLGITDHDTVAGLEEARVEASAYGIRIVPGRVRG